MSDAPRRILIVRPSALGDVARTVPALVSLKLAFPGAQIDWMVRDNFADAVAHHPDLHEVIGFPRSRFARFARNWQATREVFAFMDVLKHRRYDLAIDLQGLLRSGLFTWATRAPRRVGFAGARELAGLCYNVKYRVDAVHTVDRMLGLIEAEGIPIVRDLRLYVCESDRNWAHKWLADRRIEPGRFTLIAPTAMWRSKQWPLERFAELLPHLHNLGLPTVVLVGSSGEIEPTRILCGLPGVHDAVGKTSVGQLMALIELCALAICNDSAPLHLAMGLGKRCVGIFGPTNPAQVGPYRYEAGVVRPDGAIDAHYRDQPDDQSLIARVSVQQVTQAVDRVLSAEPPRTVWSV